MPALRARDPADETRDHAGSGETLGGDGVRLGALSVFGHAGAQFVLQRREVGHALVDLDEEVGARAVDVFVAELDDHLGDAADSANDVDWVAFTGRVGVAAHSG